MFKIKRIPEEESVTVAASKKVQEEPVDVIRTLDCSTSAKLRLKRNPMRPVYFRAAAAAFLPQDEKSLNEARAKGVAGGTVDEHLQMKERIFSISSGTTVPSNKSVITFLASICLYGFIAAFLQVAQAQFSLMGANQNSQYNNQKQLPSDMAGMMPGYGNNNQAQPATQSMVTPSSLQARSDGRYVSIDRFDSGEQIRPPLLGQPTTLAPSNKPQQVSAYQNGNFNLEASASDSYMTPEERDQLLRQQENHYEGRDSDKSSYQQADNPAATGSGYSKLAKDGSSSADPDEPTQPVLENRSLQSDATNAAANEAAGDADDSDYDQDEEPQQQQGQKKQQLNKGASGRTGSESGNNKQATSNKAQTRRTMHANDNGDESEPNDDFGGVNDDAYFSRQSNGASGSHPGTGLSDAASQHQNKGSSSSANQHNRSNARYSPDGQVSDGKEAAAGAADEDQGFGPGPNEAYLADQADASAQAGMDPEDEGETSSLNDMDGGKADRRAEAKLNAVSVGDSGDRQNSFNGDEDSDADEAADSSDDSFVPSLSSTEPGSNSQSRPQLVAREFTSPVTAQSVATAASSIENVRSSAGDGRAPQTISKSTLPLFGIQRHHQQPAASATKQYMQQVGAGQQPQLPTGANLLPSSPIGLKHHKSAFNAAYNPQNNPSHIGKFFIN